MNLNQLKYFYSVCIYGSISDAAQHLYISQPSLSSSIKMLENEFGVSLFNRRHNGMELTQEGKVLFKMCKDILQRTDQLEKIMKDFGNKRNKLRLGISTMMASLILPNIYRDFCQFHPDITIETIEGGRTELLDMLSENYIDAVLLLQNNPLDTKFESTKVTQLEIVCCASKDNPIAQYKSVTPQILKDTPLVLYKNNFFLTAEIKKWFVSEKINPNIILQTNQLSTMLTMISSNVAVGFILRQLAEANESFVAITTEKPMCVDASLVCKKDSYHLGCMDEFKEYLIHKEPFFQE